MVGVARIPDIVHTVDICTTRRKAPRPAQIPRAALPDGRVTDVSPSIRIDSYMRWPGAPADRSSGGEVNASRQRKPFVPLSGAPPGSQTFLFVLLRPSDQNPGRSAS